MNFSEFSDAVTGGADENGPGLRNIYDHLLASGADVRAVLEGRAIDETSEAQGQFRQLELSLRNVMGLSQRLRRDAQRGKLTTERALELAGHFARFCAEAGVVPTILRGDSSAEAPSDLTRARGTAERKSRGWRGSPR